MTRLLKRLKSKELINCPSFLIDNTPYLVMMGSISYGVSNDSSDIDVYGFCIPPKEDIFPHLKGEIPGFGQQIQRFQQFQQHHVVDKEAKKEYDFSIYNIVKYFQLCMENNPNMIDSLFVPQRCILHCTKVGNHIRDNRKLFLHKGAWYKFKGYSYSQLHKLKNKNPEGKRKEIVKKYGFDVKFGYHIVRLLNQIEQILVEQNIDLERNREQLKTIRRGEWTQKQLEDYFHKKESELETLYLKSQLRHSPDQKKIKNLLLECLEIHYGNLDNIIVNVDKYVQAIGDIRKILSKI